MIIDRRRLIISFVLNIIMILICIISLILEIIDIHRNPDSVYQTVWGLFRYFTIDGNLLSLVFNIIITIKQIKALKTPKTEDIRPLINTHFLYIISLMSACTDLVIFIVVVVIFMPMADSTWQLGLVGSFNASSFHITIPILLNLRFIFLDVRERDFRFYEKLYGGIPMCLYGVIMFILCGAKVFKSFNKDEGDGKIPYPFLDVYHQSWWFCTFCALFIFVFGFGIGFLLDFLNKKCQNLIFPYAQKEDAGLEYNVNGNDNGIVNQEE